MQTVAFTEHNDVLPFFTERRTTYIADDPGYPWERQPTTDIGRNLARRKSSH